ncbi:hypothetical protein SDC9_188425 [bioreactor metagenome]|uniref:Uncharacterized protein n=1 Tax=bioreactor metagenome TaxID=1076179 RepID=A0A645HPA6_9ZZZZ
MRKQQNVNIIERLFVQHHFFKYVFTDAVVRPAVFSMYAVNQYFFVFMLKHCSGIRNICQ